MKKLLFIVLFLAYHCSYSQVFTDKKDAFTGKQVKMATVVFGSKLAPVPITLSFGVSEGKKYIAFLWTGDSGVNGAFNNVNKSTTSLLFKMDTDSILKFKSDPDLTNAVNTGNMSMLSIISFITDKELMFFASHKISLFRVGMRDDVGVDMESHLFTNKNRDQVQKAAAYMLDMQVLPETADQ